MRKHVDVSVVIPCYNAERTLKRSLISIQAQTVLPREIIVVDDGSDIPLEALFDELVKGITIPVQFIRQQNLGAPAARNAGVSLAKSEFVALLDADDVWFPEKLEIQYNTMIKYGFQFCGHGYSFFLGKSTLDQSRKVRVVKKWEFAFHNPYFTPTVMFRRDYFKGFDIKFRRVDDYKAWVECFKPGAFGYISATLASGFKPPIGHSGLTKSVKLMHRSYISVLGALLEEKSISRVFYVAAVVIEMGKLPFRFLRSVKSSFKNNT